MHRISIFAATFLLGLITLSVPALAQDIGSPDPEVLKGLYPGKAYSPYASVLSQAMCTGARRTCTPGCLLMPAYSAISWATKMPTASHAAKK